MRDRTSLVVLYEDEFHETFISAFLNRLDASLRSRTRFVPQENKAGVFRAFPEEVGRLRRAHVRVGLIVVVDGDELNDAQILDRLRVKLRQDGQDDNFGGLPILVIHPRWEMENWALHLLGESIGEDRDRKAREKVGDRGREAGRHLADTCQRGELPQPALPSLEAACQEWQTYRARHGL